MVNVGRIWAETVSRGTVFIEGSINLDVNADGASVDGYDAYGEGFTASVIADGEVEITLRNKPSRILHADGKVWTDKASFTLGTLYNVDVEALSATDADVQNPQIIKFHITDRATNLHAKPKPNERFSFKITAQHWKQ